MSRKSIPDKRFINGTFGECYINGIHFADIEEVKLEVDIERKEINQAGSLGEGSKIIGTKGSGTIKFKKVYSREVALILPIIKTGKDIRALITTNIDDPDAYGSEKIQIVDAWFNNLTLTDWSVKNLSTRELKIGFNPDNVEAQELITD